ncbi:VWA domain-containing protein [Alloacidobacterium dinghuense]|uniref:VWA domain-containing protein n=1 Tax=Alloacidobacterium dinghuense TaxID=2763107 RepID=A0A7G8BN21_9BACT|nr:VWA domain-containing protein [Alloacidobacterium dinghuense]QNI33941.1 VWA domain-containing protein [Alloacidobacterium dinghuense]
MTRIALTLLLVLPGLTPALAQQPQGTTTLTVSSTLVQVPVQVKTKSGKNVYELTPDNFLVTDNGIPQTITLDDDTGSQPLALAIVVQTGGAGTAHINDYQGLGALIDAIVGNVDHLVAVVSFDSRPHILQAFTPNTTLAAKQLNNLQPGDNGAAILDGVAFAVNQLRQQPANYRHAILLFSETLDQDSDTTLEEALRLISNTNTTMYTFAFSSTHAAVHHEASKFNQYNPGPTHGCFNRDGADAEYEGHYSKQVLDCISQLAPPVRLATMAFVAARNALRTNTAESIAQLTGGEFAHFKNAKDLQNGLAAVSNDVPNFYLLSFRPQPPTPGMHTLHVELKGDEPHLEVKARSAYWIDDAK